MIFNRTPSEYLKKPNKVEKPSLLSKRILRTQSVINSVADTELEKELGLYENERYMNNIGMLDDVISLKTSLDKIRQTKTRMPYNPERKSFLRKNGYVVTERDFKMNDFVDAMDEVISTSKRIRPKTAPLQSSLKANRDTVLRISDIENLVKKSKEQSDAQSNAENKSDADLGHKSDDESGRHTPRPGSSKRRPLPIRIIEPPRQGRHINSHEHNLEALKRAKEERAEKQKSRRDAHYTKKVDDEFQDPEAEKAKNAEADEYRIQILRRHGIRSPKPPQRRTSGKPKKQFQLKPSTPSVLKHSKSKSLTQETVDKLTTPKVVKFEEPKPVAYDVKEQSFVAINEMPVINIEDDDGDDDDKYDEEFDRLMKRHTDIASPVPSEHSFSSSKEIDAVSVISDNESISSNDSESKPLTETDAKTKAKSAWGKLSGSVRMHPRKPSLLTAKNLVLYEKSQRNGDEGGVDDTTLWSKSQGSTVPPAASSEVSSARSKRSLKSFKEDQWLNLMMAVTGELEKKRIERSGGGGRRSSSLGGTSTLLASKSLIRQNKADSEKTV